MTNLTIKAVNKDNKEIIVDWEDSKVKVKGGLYKRLANNTNTDTIQPGDSASTVYDATFAHDANRRYQIAVTDGDNDDVIYFPSRSTWTTDSTPVINVTV